ncbi:hypothetical protein VNI00_016881 [Paramarasmius palmivorus]|uniref:Uncharacterized protein n=1 Tax=Paramarasmius palmivorus TaxID=297713 RepID=A0AAW0BA44_9AGAR
MRFVFIIKSQDKVAELQQIHMVYPQAAKLETLGANTFWERLSVLCTERIFDKRLTNLRSQLVPIAPRFSNLEHSKLKRCELDKEIHDTHSYVMTQPQLANMVVAFGATSDSFFIAAGARTHSDHISKDMNDSLVTQIHTPIDYASLGPSGEWFLRGRNPHDKTRYTCCYQLGVSRDTSHHQLYEKLQNDNHTYGVTFGPNYSSTWFKRNGRHWEHYNFEHIQAAWVTQTQEDHPGMRFRIVTGARRATVILFEDGRIAWHSLADNVADTLSAARKLRLRVRDVEEYQYLALSPTHPNHVFVQFEDGSVTWWAPRYMAERLKEYAQHNDLVHRLSARKLQPEVTG